MANQNTQQKQIKGIFKLNNLTRVETTQNRRILGQLDMKLINLNHSVYSLQAETGKLQIDRVPSNYEGKGIWDYYRLLEDKKLSLQRCTVHNCFSASH